MSFTVRIVSWSDAAQQLSAVRRIVFVEEQKVPEELEWDGEDETAIHVLASDAQGTPVGTGRLLIHDQLGHIGRMAVTREWRGRGVGSAVLGLLIREIERIGLSGAFLNAQTYAVPFYERFGFLREGEEFLDAGMPHYRMIKSLLTDAAKDP
jgi:predicted GNAT family N-acyltransferase